MGKKYAWDGPFEKLPKGPPVPISDALLPALEAAGYDYLAAQSGDLWNEQSQGFKQIFEIDRHNRIHEIIAASRHVLLVRPKLAVKPTP